MFSCSHGISLASSLNNLTLRILPITGILLSVTSSEQFFLMWSELLRTQLATYYNSLSWFETEGALISALNWYPKQGRLKVWRSSNLCRCLLSALLLLRIKRWEMGFSLVPNPDGSRWLDSHRKAPECRGVDMSVRISIVHYGEGVGQTGGRLEEPQLLTQERRTPQVSFHLCKWQPCTTEHQLDLKHQVRTSKLDPGLPTTQAVWTVTETHYGKPSIDWVQPSLSWPRRAGLPVSRVRGRQRGGLAQLRFSCAPFGPLAHRINSLHAGEPSHIS